MTDHPTTRDWQNRAERAEAECNELRERLRKTVQSFKQVHRHFHNAMARIETGESNGQ